MYEPLTKEQAMECDTFHQNGQYDSKGNCRIWRRNGKTQTWKRDERRFRVPVKHGLYAYDAITEDNAGMVHVDETCQNVNRKARYA